MKKHISVFLVMISFFKCSYRESTNISPVAKSYIAEVITLLQSNSINKNNINWQDFKKDIYKHANGCVTIESTYPSIAYAIEKLNDKHSYFAPNTKLVNLTDLKPPPILADEIVPKNLGYIRLGYCIGNNEQMHNYIYKISHKIAKQDNENLKGWIVDLRGNFGGNMWKMLSAISPIIGEGVLGYFCYPNDSSISWNYKEGKVFDEKGIWSQSTTTYSLKLQNPYVAVLTDKLTASSGEAIAIAFKGRSKTKSFGTQTFGVSTANCPHTLSDGSIINLTESLFADRNKIKYGSSVTPDFQCGDNKTLQEAIKWLQNPR